MAGQASTNKNEHYRPLNCDQIAWLNDVLNRYSHVVCDGNPRISRYERAAKLAALLEIMELTECRFADATAAGNAIFQFPELNILRRHG